MQTSKKRIYGAIGLASVVAMTVAAYNVPAPAAYANTGVPFTVTVSPNNLSTQITGNIKNGSQTAESPVEIEVTFSHAGSLRYTVSITQDGRTVSDVATKTVDVSTIPGVTAQSDGYAGTYIASIDADQLLRSNGFDVNKKASFTFSVLGFSPFGGTSVGDAIAFTYGQIAIDPGQNINPDAEEGETNVPTNENGDPVITIETGDNVQTIHVAVIDPVTGEIVLELDIPATPGGITNLTIPFSEYGIEAGDYIIRVTAYDAAGNVVGSSDLEIYYAPKIGLPNTGGSIFTGLNIGRTDFLISGLLVFGLSAIGGLVLMNRSKKAGKRTRK